MPGHGKQYPAIVGLGDHDSVITLQKRLIQDQMYPLARFHHMLVSRHIHFHNAIHKDAGRITHRFHFIFLPVHQILNLHPSAPAIGSVQHRRYFHTVDRTSAIFDTGLSQIDCQARIVELTVMIDNPSLQTIHPDRR